MTRWMAILALLGGLLVGLLPIGTTAWAAGATYYLAPWGDDANPGTAERPWATLHHVAQHVGQSGFPGPGDTLLVRGGTYRQAATFPRGGSPGAPLTIQAYPGERPIFDGSMEISGGWRHVGGTVWAREFTRNGGLHTVAGHLDPAPVSTTPDGFAAGGDRSAFLYVDDTPDTDHWLRPYSLAVAGDGLAGNWANLPARGFGTTAPPPPQGDRFYAGRADTIYINLGHLADPDPNHHLIRLPAYEHALLLWGPDPSHLVFRGLTFQLYPTGQESWSAANDITIDANEWRLFKQRVINTYRCATGWRVTNNWFHHYSYEAIHVESNGGLVEGNLMENTLIGYAPWGPGGLNVLGDDNLVRRNVGRYLKAQHEGTNSGTGGDPFAVESWNLCGSKSGQRNVFEQNAAHDVEGIGFHVMGGDGTIFRNNLAFRNSGAGFLVEGGGTGGGLGEGDTYARGTRFEHNTAADNGESGFNSAPKGRETVITNNIAVGSGVREILIHGGATLSEANNLLAGDPGFVDRAGGDLQLRAGSPAIDRAAPSDVSNDFAGGARPQGGGADIGAHEFGASPTNPPLTPGPSGSPLPAPTPGPGGTPDPTFPDVPAAHPYHEAITQLAALGIIRGYEDGRFGPDDPLLRAQVAALIARALGWGDEDWGTPFPDRGAVDDELWRHVGTLAHYDVARGFADGTFNPTGPVVHGQVISFIARAMIARGEWALQPDDPALYPNVPAASGHRADLATYVHYAGAVPGTDLHAVWAAWDAPASRGWFAQALWQVLRAR